jgi:hypothetical protein
MQYIGIENIFQNIGFIVIKDTDFNVDFKNINLHIVNCTLKGYSHKNLMVFL